MNRGRIPGRCEELLPAIFISEAAASTNRNGYSIPYSDRLATQSPGMGSLATETWRHGENDPQDNEGI